MKYIYNKIKWILLKYYSKIMKTHTTNKTYAICCSFNKLPYLCLKIMLLRKDIFIKYYLTDENINETVENDEIKTISFEELKKLSENNSINGVILSAAYADHTVNNSIWGRTKKLFRYGIKNVLCIPATLEWTPIYKMTKIDKKNFITDIEQFSEPLVVKFLAYEGCNLNCSGCTHFASINQNPKMMTVDELNKDLLQLKKKFGYIKCIQFLGGEPLMNPQLSLMIKKVRKIFPYAQINVLTNGLLLMNTSKKLLNVLKNKKTLVFITQYKPVTKILPDITTKLDKNRIKYVVTSKIENFRIQYNQNGTGDAVKNFENCPDWACHTIVNGKIGGCYYAGLVKYANIFWNLNIPGEQYMYDLYSDEYTGAQLLKKLTSVTPLCSFCNGIPSPTIPWRCVAKDPVIADWFYN